MCVPPLTPPLPPFPSHNLSVSAEALATRTNAQELDRPAAAASFSMRRRPGRRRLQWPIPLPTAYPLVSRGLFADPAHPLLLLKSHPRPRRPRSGISLWIPRRVNPPPYPSFLRLRWVRRAASSTRCTGPRGPRRPASLRRERLATARARGSSGPRAGGAPRETCRGPGGRRRGRARAGRAAPPRRPSSPSHPARPAAQAESRQSRRDHLRRDPAPLRRGPAPRRPPATDEGGRRPRGVDRGCLVDPYGLAWHSEYRRARVNGAPDARAHTHNTRHAHTQARAHARTHKNTQAHRTHGRTLSLSLSLSLRPSLCVYLCLSVSSLSLSLSLALALSLSLSHAHTHTHTHTHTWHTHTHTQSHPHQRAHTPSHYESYSPTPVSGLLSAQRPRRVVTAVSHSRTRNAPPLHWRRTH